MVLSDGGYGHLADEMSDSEIDDLAATTCEAATASPTIDYFLAGATQATAGTLEPEEVAALAGTLTSIYCPDEFERLTG